MVQIPGDCHIGILFQIVILPVLVFVQRFIADAQIIAQKLHGHCLFFVKVRDFLAHFLPEFLRLLRQEMVDVFFQYPVIQRVDISLFALSATLIVVKQAIKVMICDADAP